MRLLTGGKLTVAADYSFPPFAFRGGDGDLEGFDVDVIEAIGRELDLEVDFVNRGTGALVAGALAHRHDLAASAIRADDSLRDETCMSIPYLDADLGVLIRAADRDAIGGVPDLGGKTVAVLDGGRAARWVDEVLDDSTVASVPTADDAIAAVRSGQANAAVDELAMVRFAVKSTPDLALATRIRTGESFVFVGAPDNAGLMAKVNSALQKLRRNGTLRKLQQKWFG